MNKILIICGIILLTSCGTTNPATQPVEKQEVYIKSIFVDKKAIHFKSFDGVNFKVIGDQPLTGTSNDTGYSPIKSARVPKL